MKNAAFLILGTLLSIVGLGAISAGFAMILHPHGSSLKISTDILQNSPFPNYLIPGLFLFCINGIFNLLAAVLTFLKNRLSGALGILLGGTLIAWILVQLYFIGLSSFLQIVFLVIGMAEIVIGFFLHKKYQ